MSFSVRRSLNVHCRIRLGSGFFVAVCLFSACRGRSALAQGGGPGCDVLSGSAKSVATTGDPGQNMGYRETIVSDLKFVQDQSYQGPGTYWKLDSGNAAWSAFGQIGECSVSGQDTRVTLGPEDGSALIAPDGTYQIQVTASRLASAAEIRTQCPGQDEVTTPPSFIEVMGVYPFEGFKVSADGNQLQGAKSQQAGIESSWSLSRCKSITVTAPTADEHLVPGETYEITWESSGVEEVNLILKTRDGQYFADIKKNLPANPGSFNWKVPDSLARRAEVLVEDASTPAVSDKSDQFRIKGYVLTRVRNDEYERFEPSRNGWKAANSRGSWDPPSYADTGQFDYATAPPGTDPFIGRPYPAEQFKPLGVSRASHEDFPSMVRAFGHEPFYWEPAANGIYKHSGLAFWVGKSDPDWGGSCSGMSVTALMAFSEPAKFGGKFQAIGHQEYLFDVIRGATVSDPVRSAVNTEYAYWNGVLARNHFAANKGKSPRMTLEDLKQMLLDKNERHESDAYLYIQDANGAHAIVPIEMSKLFDDSAQYMLEVYDPNDPGERKRLLVDSTANSWHYPGWGSRRFLLMDRVANYYPVAVYPGSSAAAKHQLDDEWEIIPTGWADIRIDGAAGSLGFVDSTAYSSMPDVEPVFEPTGYPSTPTYRLPPANYRVTQFAYREAEARLMVRSGQLTYLISRTDAAPEQTDHFSLGDGIGIRNGDGASKSFSFHIVAPPVDEDHVYQIEGLTLGGEDSVRVRLDPDDLLRLENLGESKTYALLVRTAGSNGLRTFTHPAVSIDAGAVHQVVPDWADLGRPILIRVDSDSDGTFDSSFEIVHTGASRGDAAGPGPGYRFALYPNYPNPFSESTTIEFELSSSGDIRLAVLDVLGREVRLLQSGPMAAGRHEVTFDASGLPAGVYRVSLRAGARITNRSLTVVR